MLMRGESEEMGMRSLLWLTFFFDRCWLMDSGFESCT